LHFKIDWASLIVGTKFTVFALFNFVFEGNFPNRGPRGGFWRGHLTEGFFALPVWGAYTWTGLFSEFYGMCLYVVTESSLSTLSGIVCHVSSGCFMVEVKSNVKL